MIWTDAQVAELTRRWKGSETAQKIADAMGTTKHAVIGKARKLKIGQRPNPKLPSTDPARILKARELRSSGMTWTEVGQQLGGISKSRAQYLATKAKLVVKAPETRVQRAGEMADSGIPIEQIAREMKISRKSAVSYVAEYRRLGTGQKPTAVVAVKTKPPRDRFSPPLPAFHPDAMAVLRTAIEWAVVP